MIMMGVGETVQLTIRVGGGITIGAFVSTSTDNYLMHLVVDSSVR